MMQNEHVIQNYCNHGKINPKIIIEVPVQNYQVLIYTIQPQEHDINQMIQLLADKNSYIKGYQQWASYQDSNLAVIDVKLNFIDMHYDKVYASNRILHNTYRRGLTLIVYQEKGLLKKQILRRGFQKFFDIDIELFRFLLQRYEAHEKNILYTYIASNLQNNKDKLESALNWYTFGTVCQNLEQNRPVSIMITEKANGENAQISYFKPYDLWAISSKNVTILCKDNEENTLPYVDIENKPSDPSRYAFATKIAQVWFQQIKNGDQAALKQYFQDKTLVGEYCGNQEHQHLVKYDEIHLRFYAVVNNEGVKNCLNPILAMQTLNEFNLRVVKHQIFANGIADLGQFSNAMIELYKQVALSPVDLSPDRIADGEGGVVYFIDTQTGECLSLGKLKTLEYRLKRKLREKISGLLNLKFQQIQFADYIHTFNQQSEELIRLATNDEQSPIWQLFRNEIQLILRKSYWLVTAFRIKRNIVNKNISQEIKDDMKALKRLIKDLFIDYYENIKLAPIDPNEQNVEHNDQYLTQWVNQVKAIPQDEDELSDG